MALAVALATPVHARDLGVRGATWPIAEPDLLVEIETRLSAMQRSGEMARIEAEARSRARARLEEPTPVPGIAPAREARSRLFDLEAFQEVDTHHADQPALAITLIETQLRLLLVQAGRVLQVLRGHVDREAEVADTLVKLVV